MLTYNGKIIDFAHIDPYAINISDIAHSLSQLCRFGGHTRIFYSVANHSLLVAMNVPAEDAFSGLMHDATEAYCQDLIGPIKQVISGYADIEASIWEAIAWRFKLPEKIPQSVKDMDKIVCMTEIRDLMSGHIETIPSEAVTLEHRIQPLSQAASRHCFLKEFHKQRGLRNAKR
jgi:uncharacterized protein